MTEEKVDDLPEDVDVSDAVEEKADDRLDRKTVSKIVERERQKAYEKARREAMMEQQAMQEGQAQAQPQATQSPNLGGMNVSPEQLQSMIAQQVSQNLPQHLQEHIQGIQTQHLVNSFTEKMQAAEARHPGLNDKLNKIEDYSGITPIIQMANNMENTGDIMAELLNNPGKMGSILSLTQAGQRQYAQQMMHDLSNSIKVNQEAVAKEKQAQDPIAQLKSSSMTTGMDDKDLSVMDLRKMLSQRR
jgi:hypothetical protein